MQLTPNSKFGLTQRGFSLVELMVSLAVGLIAMTSVMSIYVANFAIDSKVAQFSKLNDEVKSVLALMVSDIRRAGYAPNSDVIFAERVSPGVGVTRCEADATACIDDEFRVLSISKFGAEADNSCVTFAYDSDAASPGYDEGDDDMGFRLNAGAIEVRRGTNTCTQNGWEDITDTNHITISDLQFELTQSSSFSPKQNLTTDVNQIDISFTATLVSDASISIDVTETVLLRNALYN